MGIWHAGNIVSNIISGFLAAGILENMDNIVGLHSWQWFFLIEGESDAQFSTLVSLSNARRHFQYSRGMHRLLGSSQLA